MKFLSPSFLYALFFLAVPIIIHLFSFRKFKKVYFPDVRFLKEIRQEKRTSSRLRHILVLISRILFLFFLILAFAQPFIPGENSVGTERNRAISVFVDNSFSMNATGEGGRLLDIAKAKARDIVLAYQPSDRFQLLTHDFEARHQELVSRETFLNMLDEVQETPASRNLGEVVKRQEDLLSRSESQGGDLYLVSDFQKTFSDFSDVPSDTSYRKFLLPLKANRNPNIYIDSVWFESPVRTPQGNEVILARVRNSGNADVNNLPLQVFINDQQKSPASVSVPAEGTQIVKVGFSHPGPGIKSGRFSLQDHPVTYDDDFYFSYSVKEKLSILVVNGGEPNPFISSFLATEEYFQTETVSENNIDYSSFSRYQAIILNEPSMLSSGMVSSLKTFVEQGGHLILFPSLRVAPENYNPLLGALNAGAFSGVDTSEARITRVDENHELLRGVFETSPDPLALPILKNRFVYRGAGSGKVIPVADAGSRNLFLGVADRGEGRMYLFAAPVQAESGNFPRHSLFAPLMYNMILHSQRSSSLYTYLNSGKPVRYTGELGGKDKTVSVKAVTGEFEMIPELYPTGGAVYLNLHNAIPEAGNYLVEYENELVQGLALNYNRNESDMQYLAAGELQSTADDAGIAVTVIDKTGKNFSHELRELNQGKPLWKYCVWLALLFLLIEVLLLRTYQTGKPLASSV